MPPVTLAVADPSLPPLQLTFELITADVDNITGSVIAKLTESAQQALFVIVTE